MSAPGAFNRFAVHFFRSGPALRGAKNQHGPLRAFDVIVLSRRFLYGANLAEHLFEDSRHLNMHLYRLMPRKDTWSVSVSLEEIQKLFFRNASEHGGIRNLESIQMQNRQHRAVRFGVQELIGMPACRKRARLRFAIAHNASHNQIWIVERRSVGV